MDTDLAAVTDKELRWIIKQAEAQGFRVQRTSQNHLRVFPPDKDQDVVHLSLRNPSHNRNTQNAIASLKRAGLRLDDGDSKDPEPDPEPGPGPGLSEHSSWKPLPSPCHTCGDPVEPEDQERHDLGMHGGGLMQDRLLMIMANEPDTIWTPVMLAKHLPTHVDSTRSMLVRLTTRGHVCRVKPGLYRYRQEAAQPDSKADSKPDSKPDSKAEPVYDPAPEPHPVVRHEDVEPDPGPDDDVPVRDGPTLTPQRHEPLTRGDVMEVVAVGRSEGVVILEDHRGRAWRASRL